MQKGKGEALTQKLPLPIFYAYMGLTIFAANLVHPVTPKFFANLQYPDYMFGLAFALMSFGSFALSPMWSKLAHRHGYAKIMGMCVSLYGIGQLMFALSATMAFTAFARLFAGAFSAGMNIGSMLFLSNSYGEKGKGERIALGTAIQVSSGAIGYFAGGYIGNNNPLLAFYLQVAMCIAIGVSLLLFVKDNIHAEQDSLVWQDINPFKAFGDVRKIMNKKLLYFYILTACACFAFVSFETTFNYFIKKIYNLDPIYNGVIKGSIGLLGLFLNLTLTRYIATHFSPRNSVRVFLSIIPFIILSLMLAENVALFIGSALLYYAIDTVQKPIMQTIGTENPIIYGGYNSMFALGMVSGSFSAGYLFSIHPKLPFYASFVFICIALAVSFTYAKECKNATNTVTI